MNARFNTEALSVGVAALLAVCFISMLGASPLESCGTQSQRGVAIEEYAAYGQAGDVLPNADRVGRETSPEYSSPAFYPAVIDDLGTLGGAASGAMAVNNLGQVVGWAHTVGGRKHPFLWLPEPAHGLPAGMNDLLGVDDLNQGCAYDMNNHGQVVGGQVELDPNNWNGSFIWFPEEDCNMPAGLTSGFWGDCLYAINDEMQAVGYYWGDSGGNDTQYAFAWLCEEGCGLPEGVSVLYPDCGPSIWRSVALDINANGEIVGWGRFCDQPAVWDAPWLHNCESSESWDCGPMYWYPRGLNNVGEIVGGDNPWGDPAQAFLCSPAWDCNDLPGLGGDESLANAINDSSRIVGWAETAGGDRHACLWRNGEIHDLNDYISQALGWVLIEATDINAEGVVVGWGVVNGETHAFRLPPLFRCPTPGASGNYCTADIVPNNGDGVWEYGVDGDCIVDLGDLAQLLAHFGCPAGCTREDGDIEPLGGDGAVDLADLAMLLSQFGDDCN